MDALRQWFVEMIEGWDTARALPWAAGIGIVIAVLIYMYPPWGEAPPPAPPQLEIDASARALARNPLDHPRRLEMARYHLHWGLALSKAQRPDEDLATDSELIQHFEERLSEWEKMGENVSSLRQMMRGDFATFRKEYFTRERSLARSLFEQAILGYRQARALGARLTPTDLYDLGIAYYYMGPEGYAGATKYLTEAVDEGLLSNRALTFLGNVSVARGDFEKGVELYSKALDFTPDEPVLAFNIALAYKETGRLEAAVENFRTTLRLYNDRGQWNEEDLSIILQTRLALGWCLIRLKKYAEAEPEFEAVLEGQPDSLEGHYWLGVAYENQARYDAARAHWQRVRDLDPQFRDVKERLAGLQAMIQGRAMAVPR